LTTGGGGSGGGNSGTFVATGVAGANRISTPLFGTCSESGIRGIRAIRNTSRTSSAP
jgi:hypothetical protein